MNSVTETTDETNRPKKDAHIHKSRLKAKPAQSESERADKLDVYG